MYQQELSVKFHEMEQQAQNLADRIEDLTRGIDRNQLVIMCGENHENLAHQFFETRLMSHLHGKMSLGHYFSEWDSSNQDYLQKISPDADYLFNAITMAEIEDYDLGQFVSAAFACQQGIKVRFIDIPLIVDGNDDYIEPMDKSITHHIKNVVDKRAAHRIYSKGRVQSTSPSGVARRDLYMFNMIQDVMAQNTSGPAMLLNGCGHVFNSDTLSLASHLLKSNKHLVMLSFHDGDDKKTMKDFNDTLSAKDKNKVIAEFCLSLPEYGSYEIEDDVDSWGEMAYVNNLPCPITHEPQ